MLDGFNSTNLIKIFLHCSLWSVLSIGGNTVALSDIFQYAVNAEHWVTATDFVVFFAISQALPGPNGMALVLIGQRAAGLSGALVALFAKLIPSSIITFWGAFWYEKNRNSSRVMAFRTALVPVTIGLNVAATLLLVKAIDTKTTKGLLTLASTFIVYRYKINPFILILIAGAIGSGSVILGIDLF